MSRQFVASVFCIVVLMGIYSKLYSIGCRHLFCRKYSSWLNHTVHLFLLRAHFAIEAEISWELELYSHDMLQANLMRVGAILSWYFAENSHQEWSLWMMRVEPQLSWLLGIFLCFFFIFFYWLFLLVYPVCRIVFLVYHVFFLILLFIFFFLTKKIM